MSDYYSREYDTLSTAPRKDNLFLWTIFILLLTGFAMACWLGSFYIFGHPENIESYKILTKLHKIDPPKRFELTAAPPGEFLNAQKLYERYNSYPPLRLQAENAELLRMYINNYQDANRLVPYIVGSYTILDTRELGPGDIFTSGVAAVAASADFPQVLLEHVYTSQPKDVPALQAMLRPGLDVKLARTLDLAAIIHVERLPDGTLQFTAVPLLYGSYALKDGAGTFSLQPPPGINLAAGMPIVRGPEIAQDLQLYAQYQQQHAPASSILNQPLTTPSPTPSTNSELVRVDSGPAPEIQLPMRGRRGKKGRASPAASVAVAMVSPTQTELAMADQQRPILPGVAVGTPQPQPGNGVLTPFLQSAPEPVLTNNGATWRTYAPGQMPTGRVIDPTDAAPLADAGLGGERLYLRGSFVVTASEENRAVLRPLTGGITSFLKPAAGATRVIVEFPAGMEPPAEGSTFDRDDTRPFMITDVRRGADGEINLYVREITSPQ
jgi:hypothetical protein